MKKIKKFLCLLCTAILLSIIICDVPTYAQEETVVVTPDTLGSDDSIYIVRITKRVVEIQDGSFSNLVNLQEIRVDNDNPYYASYGGCLYNKDYTTLICIPQNTTSVQIKTSITSYTPHALDGLSQERKDALDQFLNDKSNNIQSSDPVSTYTTQPTYTDSSDTVPAVTTNTRTDFSEYVYTDEKGRTAFKYTGTGDSAIYIPEGVQIIAGFGESIFDLNYEITYVYLPSTIVSCLVANIYNRPTDGEDNNLYNCLYQCPNLQTVEGGGKRDYICNGNTVVRGGNSGIIVWSNSEKVPYNKQSYTDYNNSKNK